MKLGGADGQINVIDLRTVITKDIFGKINIHYRGKE